MALDLGLKFPSIGVGSVAGIDNNPSLSGAYSPAPITTPQGGGTPSPYKPTPVPTAATMPKLTPVKPTVPIVTQMQRQVEDITPKVSTPSTGAGAMAGIDTTPFDIGLPKSPISPETIKPVTQTPGVEPFDLKHFNMEPQYQGGKLTEGRAL